MHLLKRTTVLPISLEEAWQFFSNPENLKEITPDYMEFAITSDFFKEEMYPGMIITYRVRPLLGIPMRWMTEITHVEEQRFFVDEQRLGPYKIWHHQHHFKETSEGLEMIDIVNYALPLGALGRMLGSGFVQKKLKEIFDYREAKIKELFAFT